MDISSRPEPLHDTKPEVLPLELACEEEREPRDDEEDRVEADNSFSWHSRVVTDLMESYTMEIQCHAVIIKQVWSISRLRIVFFKRGKIEIQLFIMG